MNECKISKIKLKLIDLKKSHASNMVVTKDNFNEVAKTINSLLDCANKIDDDDNNINTKLIKKVIRDSMIKMVILSPSHVDGTTETNSNGFNITRNGNSFVIQMTDDITNIFHSLRQKDNKLYSNSYRINIDNLNQIHLDFSPFIKDELEFTVFG